MNQKIPQNMKKHFKFLLLIAFLAISKPGYTQATVDFTMPPIGTGNDITGKLTGVSDPTQYKVLILVSGDRYKWWDKTHIQPKGFPQPDPVEAVPIKTDGSFIITYWAGNDSLGTINKYDLVTAHIGIWVVPINFNTRWENLDGTKGYQVEGKPIPPYMIKATLCYVIKDRKNNKLDLIVAENK
jgi:hypothetical protein